jgi:hypothetical protein
MENFDYSALVATRDVARGIRIVFGKYSSIRILRKIGRFEYSANSIRD